MKTLIRIMVLLMASWSFGAEIKGMAKIWLQDGRIIYGAATAEIEKERSGHFKTVNVNVTTEPGLHNYSKERTFNYDSIESVEIGITGKPASSRSVLNAVIPNWGSVAVLATESLVGTRWDVGDMRVRVVGTKNGFNLLLSVP